MKPVYEKYYNALKNTKISESSEKIVSLFDLLNKYHTTLGSNINTNLWVELGKDEIVENVLPVIIKNTESLKNNIANSLGKACKMAQNDLLNLFKSLESKEREINSLEDEERNKRQGEITSIENSIDSKIQEINSLEVADFETVEASSINIGVMLQGIYKLPIDDAGNTLGFSYLPEEIEKKKIEFLGNIDNPNEYTVDPNYVKMRKHMRLFNNTTGEEILPGSVVRLKKGEQLVITVKLPTNTGMINKIHRTTADGDDVARSKRVVHSVSNVSGDPNNITHVNYKQNFYPPGVDLHKNHYDWVIQANGVGTSSISQTCEYTAHNNVMAKAMADIKVVVEG